MNIEISTTTSTASLPSSAPSWGDSLFHECWSDTVWGFCGFGDGSPIIPPIQEFLLQSNQLDRGNLADYCFVENIQFDRRFFWFDFFLPPLTGLTRLTLYSNHPVLPGSTLETGPLFNVPFAPKAGSTALEGADLTVSRSLPGSLAGSYCYSTMEYRFAA